MPRCLLGNLCSIGRTHSVLDGLSSNMPPRTCITLKVLFMMTLMSSAIVKIFRLPNILVVVGLKNNCEHRQAYADTHTSYSKACLVCARLVCALTLSCQLSAP